MKKIDKYEEHDTDYLEEGEFPPSPTPPQEGDIEIHRESEVEDEIIGRAHSREEVEAWIESFDEWASENNWDAAIDFVIVENGKNYLYLSEGEWSEV